MRLVVVSRDNEDYTRTVEEWIHEFERRTGWEVEVLSPDEGEGETLSRAYDVIEYPTILALNDSDGGVLAMWRGQDLPTFDEVTYWVTR